VTPKPLPAGARAVHLQDYKGAREQLEAAVTVNPDFNTGYLLGRAYLVLHEEKLARTLFNEMITGLGDTARYTSILAGLQLCWIIPNRQSRNSIRHSEGIAMRWTHILPGAGIRGGSAIARSPLRQSGFSFSAMLAQHVMATNVVRIDLQLLLKLRHRFGVSRASSCPEYASAR